MLIDTHAHINLHAFKDDAGEVLQRSLDAGVTVINVGTEFNTSKQAVEMLAQYPEGVYATVGLHPSHTYDNPYLDENESAFATGREEFDYEAYKKLAQHDKVVGIGECGLDYYRLLDANQRIHANDTNGYESENQIKFQQKEAFIAQIKLAQELDKTLVIHCRPSKGSNDAYDDVLEILSRICHSESRSFVRGEESNPNARSFVAKPPQDDGKRLMFEVHSFTGSLEIAQKFIALGGYVGLNGIITFDKTGNMEKVVKSLPLERIILETDSPYLAPLPHRGKRNEPINVQEVVKKIADWQNISFNQISNQTTLNAKNLFKIV